MKLDPRHLAQLSMIVEVGSFQLAAERLGLTQPALSRNMRTLEDRLGTRLFKRDGRRSLPNEVGQRLAQNGIAIRMAQEAAEIVAEQVSKGAAGELRLGAPPILAGQFLTPILAAFMLENPNCSVTLRSALLHDLKNMLLLGQIDNILGPQNLVDTTDGLEFQSLVEDRLGLLVRVGHPLAQRKDVQPTELEQQPWLMPSRSSQLRQQAEIALLSAGITRTSIKCETDNIRSALELVEYTDMITPMPRLSVAAYLLDKLTFLTFDHPQFRRPVGIIHRTNTPNTKVQSVFLENLKKIYGSS